jgi:hypothetical protein
MRLTNTALANLSILLATARQALTIISLISGGYCVKNYATLNATSFLLTFKIDSFFSKISRFFDFNIRGLTRYN